jgi:hypothetical protein
MAVTINGTSGISGVDGSAGTPAIQGGDTNTGVFFPAADTIAFSEGGAEVARFNADSQFVAAAGTALLPVITTTGDVNTGMFFPAADTIAFAEGGVEAMRIDSSGSLFVGTSTPTWDERIGGKTTGNTVGIGFYSTSTSYTSSLIRVQAETAAGTGWYLFEGRAAAGSFQYGIRGNGTVATSDERRKKNIEPARSYLEDICKIPVVKYNWKTDENDALKELGWLAQDVEKVFPNMVVTHYDGPNDDQEVLLLKKEVFVPMLMKCIQEQQALITALTARITALEAK